VKRPILAFVAALVTWVLVASLLNRGLRVVLPGYAAAEHSMHFTLIMMLARLLIGAMASLGAGWVIGRLAPGSPRAAWLLGTSWLLTFIPVHIALWQAFPLWYHLTFLLTLVPLVILGSRLGRAGATAVTAPRTP
jgi:hypothetical protein